MLRPSRLALIWVLCLFALGLSIGTCKALGFAVPRPLDSIAWCALLAFALLAIFDALLILRRPGPQVARTVSGHLSIGRQGMVTLDVACADDLACRGMITDHAPAELAAQPSSQSFEMEPGETVRLHYQVKPLSRGQFVFERCELLVSSRLGLWGRRCYVPLPGKTRVYPDFAPLKGDRLLATDNWLSRAERDQQLLLWLNCGRNLSTQDDDLSQFDHALNACLSLAQVALRQGDAVGLATFGTDQARHIKPAKGSQQLNALLNATYDLHSSSRHADLETAGAALLREQKRRALVILITNLGDESSQTIPQMAARIGQHHRLLIVSLHEATLDRLQDEPVQTLEQALLYTQAVEEMAKRTALAERIKANGATVLEAQPRLLAPALVGAYLHLKRKGTL